MRPHRWFGVEIDDLPHLKRWLDAIRARLAVQKGVVIPPSAMDMGKDDPGSAKKFVKNALKMVETG